MPDWLDEQLALIVLGLLGGVALGLAARVGRFCTLGAVEDLLYGGSGRRMHMWAIAIGVAILGVSTASALTGWDTGTAFYVAQGWNPIAHLSGGLLFGYGMALAGNCGHGALARLGGGDLRAFLIVIVMGISAYAVLSGPLAPLRLALLPRDLLSSPLPASYAHTLSGLSGLPTWIVGAALAAMILIAPSVVLGKADRGVLGWGGLVGLSIVSGWIGSAWIADTGFAAVTPRSHSFAEPLGDTLLYAMVGGAAVPGFAVGSVVGVVVGAILGSAWLHQFRWEACEDPRELRRQIAGAVAMGAGGGIAMGCSVGQGLTAFAVLAYGAPVTLAAIFAGAAIGLRHLIGGIAAP